MKILTVINWRTRIPSTCIEVVVNGELLVSRLTRGHQLWNHFKWLGHLSFEAARIPLSSISLVFPCREECIALKIIGGRGSSLASTIMEPLASTNENGHGLRVFGKLFGNVDCHGTAVRSNWPIGSSRAFCRCLSQTLCRQFIQWLKCCLRVVQIGPQPSLTRTRQKGTLHFRT